MSSSALTKILSLPDVDYFDQEQFPDLSEQVMKKDGDWWQKGWRLFSHQNAAIHAALHMDSLKRKQWSGSLVVAPVGSGKTPVALVSSSLLKKKKTIYVTRARLKRQVRDEAYSIYAKNFHLEPKVEVHSYSELSAGDASRKGQYTGKLWEWCTSGVEHPGETMVILDEFHRLANPSAARTQRFLWDFLSLVMRFPRDQRPAIMGLSGSVSRPSVKEMAHLFYCMLGGLSPLPPYIPTSHPDPEIPLNDTVEDPALEGWANWLDKGARGGWQGSGDMDDLIAAYGKEEDTWLDPMEELLEDSGEDLSATQKIRAARWALSRRIATCPGVVMPLGNVDSGTNAELLVHYIEEDELELPEICRRWLDDYRNGRVDERIYVCDDDGTGESRIQRTLSLGFVNRWIWPEVMDQEDQDAWRLARKYWSQYVRDELGENMAPGYDTEKKVREHVMEGIRQGVDEEPQRILKDWLQQVKKWGRMIPTEAEWISEFLIDDVMERVETAERPILVWYRSLGIMEKLRERGMRVWYGDDYEPKKDAGKSVALSANSHTEGLNLQHAWADNLFIELPGSGPTQQAFGRVHRTGQGGEECRYDIYAHSAELKKVIRSVKASALRDYDLTQDPQKILIAREV